MSPRFRSSPPPTTTRFPSPKNEGLATSKNRGESFLLARFHTYTEGSQAIVVPAEISNTQRPELAEFNYIDKLVHEKLNKLRIIPADLRIR